MMELQNQSLASAPANCTLDTSYRYTFYQVTYSIIFIFGLGSNTLALQRFWASSKTLNSTAVYMVNLSVADLFFVVSLPLRIYYHHHSSQNWMPGGTFCQLTFTLKYISLYGGIFFLVCIGVDRYFAVVYPFNKRWRSVRTARGTSAGIWCLVLALSISLPFLHTAAALLHQPCLLDPSSSRNRLFIVGILLLVEAAFLLPMLLLLFSYCSILHVLRRPHWDHRRPHPRKQRTLTVIYWVVAIFLLCFAPYHFNLFWYTLTKVQLLPNCLLAKASQALHPVVLVLASSNCCLNPLIYYFSSKMFHKDSATSTGSQ
ncbi:lysophosphatidic acid receptor 6 [Lepisosteus oculatus]|nr:PREDICTED: lysophosphatidic acid receptor 6-like [Lepisosteus oculatus]